MFVKLEVAADRVEVGEEVGHVRRRNFGMSCSGLLSTALMTCRTTALAPP